MASAIFQAVQYAKYFLSSGNAHGLHSPFVYDLYTNVITDNTPFYCFEKIEAIRSQMMLSKEKIDVYDLGAGNRKDIKRSLSHIASHSVKPKKYGQLLFRLVNHFQPKNILELGTSLGITTLYLSMFSGKSHVITLEGCPNTAAVAVNNFKKVGVSNIELLVGEFNETLPAALTKLPSLDFVYFDGNHQKEATLNYFHQCLPYHHHDTVFVFDDIYWSKGMAEAWREIKENGSVTISIDLYSLGLVFFMKNLVKQHFSLRF